MRRTPLATAMNPCGFKHNPSPMGLDIGDWLKEQASTAVSRYAESDKGSELIQKTLVTVGATISDKLLPSDITAKQQALEQIGAVVGTKAVQAGGGQVQTIIDDIKKFMDANKILVYGVGGSILVGSLAVAAIAIKKLMA